MPIPLPSLSTTVSGATQLATLANAATNGMGVVNQILGVVSNIGQLAQKIQKQRDAIRDLVRKSRDLAGTITRVVNDRTPSEHLGPSLDRTLTTLREVESFMEDHLSKRRWKRVLAQFTSMPDEIERLKQAVADVIEELGLMATIDTNIILVSTAEKIDNNIEWDGPFRRLRDGLVKKDGPLFTQSMYENGPIVAYHRATVKLKHESEEGKVMIFRFVDTPSIRDGEKDVASSWMKEYDEMLGQMAKVALQHPYVSLIYGRTSGGPLDRATAFDVQLHTDLMSAATFVLKRKEINTSSGIALKLMDAASHLSRHGIDWIPQTKDVRVNHKGEPIIGLDMDLHKKVEAKAVTVYQTQMDTVYILYEKLPSWEVRAQIKEVRLRLAMEIRALGHDRPSAVPVAKPLSRMLATLTTARKVSIVIPKSDFVTYLKLPNLRLTGSDDYLSQVYTKLSGPAAYLPWVWARIMILLAKGTDCTEFRADYCPSDEGDELVLIWLNAGRATKVWLDLYHVDIPARKRDEFRSTLNIASLLETSHPATLKLL
ncbi:hypothetical protein AURDEDRAFT_184247 [Auricularia subglabra TFB-10046 SS5]|nr:hypothetical protein AURDEDRAFT_184247 [Auricularia subglabra TFB-10046 SS5]